MSLTTAKHLQQAVPEPPDPQIADGAAPASAPNRSPLPSSNPSALSAPLPAPGDAALETELKDFIIRTLCLEDITVDDIPSDMILFGEGLGLDSVDALELAIALQKTYGVTLDSKEEKTIYYLTCVKNLAELVGAERG